MGHLDWKVEASRVALEDKWIRVRSEDCIMPSGTRVEPYYVLDYPDWVNVVAVTSERQVVMTRQYRHGLKVSCCELPSGAVDRGEAPEDAVRRELLEETGFRAGGVEKILEIAPNPANQSNLNHCYLATGVEWVSEQNLDETEEIEVELVPLESLYGLVEKGVVLQSLHVSSILMAVRLLEDRGALLR